MKCLLALSLLMLVYAGACAADDASYTFGNKHFSIRMDSTGKVLGLFDSKGNNYASAQTGSLAVLKQDSALHQSVSVKKIDGGFLFTFPTGSTAEVLIASRPDYVEFLVGRTSEAAEMLVFPDILLKPRAAKPTFTFAAIAMKLNTDISELPNNGLKLEAIAHRTFGIEGAKTAIIGCNPDQMRGFMKKVVYAARADMPYNPYGGPYAMDHKFNRGSYIVDCLQIREDTADVWIRICKETGIRQVDINNYNFFNGEYKVNPEVVPGGEATLRKVISKLHKAGIRCGLHTYSFLVAKDSEKYLKPNPDPRLLKGRRFRLTEGIGATERNISLSGNPTVEQGTVLRIDNELIVVGPAGASGFVDCDRGTSLSTASAHAAGAEAVEIRQVYNMFLPDVHTSLYKEVAHNIARFYNEFDFDMIYLDAMDAYTMLDKTENGWYWATQFVNELVKSTKKPIMLEASTLWHGLWFARSRMGAWDVPVKGEKECFDLHFVSNLISENIYLPPHLGWCDVFKWNPVQPERTFMDDVEYLLCKSVAADCGLSMQLYLNPDNYVKSENAQRLAKMMLRYQTLKDKQPVSDSIKRMLGISGQDYTLEDNKGKLQFRQIDYSKHKVNLRDPQSASWSLNNRYKSQPAGVRIEALMSIENYDFPPTGLLAGLLTDFSESSLTKAQQIRGVPASSFSVATAPDLGRTEPLACISAQADSPLSWVEFGAKTTYPIDFQMKGFGVWVYGDQQGEIINIQSTSAPSMGSGYTDRYIVVDFKGWKYFELVEPESSRITDYDWPFAAKKSTWAYTAQGPAKETPRVDPATMAYTYYVNYGAINSLTSFSIWLNNLPVGKEAKVYLSPIKTLPLKYAELNNPSVTVAGKKITFPTTLKSGEYLEYLPGENCQVYDADGKLIRTIKPQGSVELTKGKNNVGFECTAAEGNIPRANVTLITKGELLNNLAKSK